MSNRTSEANKAISVAWTKEQQLIREGKGTYDWTAAQQQEILDRGKAYGDDGRAFEGHHMKSAERFPEHQGDPKNIQFLSRPEHFAAHDGNFQNSTNGFYNPITGVTKHFGLDKFEPCEIIELSTPIISTGNQAQNTTESTDASVRMSVRNVEATFLSSSSSTTPSGFVGIVKRFAGKAVKFYVRHKNIIDPIAITAAVTIVVIIEETLKGSSKSRSRDDSDDDDYTTSSLPTNTIEEHNTSPTIREDITKRSSPSEHTVSAHRQRYNGEWKEKKPYVRSKTSEE
jgi:hypothetical protein